MNTDKTLKHYKDQQKKLKNVRKDSKLTMREAAAKIGVTPKTLHAWENGELWNQMERAVKKYELYLNKVK